MRESPREIFANSCSEIAGHFADRGYRFARSGPHASRRTGDFTFRIGFQSSHHNAEGSVVKLWIHATVLSNRLEQWRKSYPELRPINLVAGGQIGNLEDNAHWYDWNLADPFQRQSVIDEAIGKIESIALPYFARFERLDSLSIELQETDIPSMSIERVIEFLMCFADHGAARNAASKFLSRNPNLVTNYERDLDGYIEHGLKHKRPSGYAGHLAFASVLFGFGNLIGK
jgi:hypothetical protein